MNRGWTDSERGKELVERTDWSGKEGSEGEVPLPQSRVKARWDAGWKDPQFASNLRQGSRGSPPSQDERYIFSRVYIWGFAGFQSGKQKTTLRAILADVRFDLGSPPPEIIEKAAQVIRQGGIVLYPTDTLYGLGCDPFNEDALQRLFAVKGRSQKKGVLLLVPNSSYATVVSSDIPNVFSELMEAFWPGPVTLLLKGNSSCPRLLLGEEGKVGLRHPDLAFLQLWMDAIPGPIVSTSANRSGEPSPSLEDLKQLFDLPVDLILEGTGMEQPSEPSTVVDLTMDPPQIVRAGRWASRVGEFLTRK